MKENLKTKFVIKINKCKGNCVWYTFITHLKFEFFLFRERDKEYEGRKNITGSHFAICGWHLQNFPPNTLTIV